MEAKKQKKPLTDVCLEIARTIDELASRSYGIYYAVCAYSDCIPAGNNNDAESSDLRNLSYFCAEAMDADKLVKFTEKVVGSYNSFDVDAVKAVVGAFGTGKGSHYFIAREGSPAIYVKPDPAQKRIWLRDLVMLQEEARTDELSYDYDKGMFRLWWD
jgi:hypothetical protein